MTRPSLYIHNKLCISYQGNVQLPDDTCKNLLPLELAQKIKSQKQEVSIVTLGQDMILCEPETKLY